MATLSLTNLLIAATIGAALAGLVYVAARHSVAAIALLLAAWALNFALRDPLELAVTVASTRIFLLDLICTALVVVAVTRALRGSQGNAGRILVFALLALLAFHIARGVFVSGLQTGFNDARTWFYFSAALAYAATVPGGWSRTVWKVVIMAAAAVALVAVPYFFIDGIHSASGQIYVDGTLINWRPIVAAGALLALQGVILSLTLKWPSRTAGLYFAAGATAVLLLLQHRTVWIAALLTGFMAVVYWFISRADKLRIAAIVAACLVVFGVPVAVWGSSHAGALVDSIEEPASKDSTLIWRTDGWAELISTNDAISQVAAGNPAGEGFEREVNGNALDVSAHNEYLDAYVRFGMPGVLVLCALGLVLFLHRKQVAVGTGLTSFAVGLLLLTQLVFSLAYSLDVLQGVIAGTMVSGLSASARRAQDRSLRDADTWAVAV